MMARSSATPSTRSRSTTRAAGSSASRASAEAITFGNSVFYNRLARRPRRRSSTSSSTSSQYDKLGPERRSSTSYFGLSLATIIKRAIAGEPIEAMQSSPHERDAYALETAVQGLAGREPVGRRDSAKIEPIGRSGALIGMEAVLEQSPPTLAGLVAAAKRGDRDAFRDARSSRTWRRPSARPGSSRDRRPTHPTRSRRRSSRPGAGSTSLRDPDAFRAWFRRHVVRAALKAAERRGRVVELDLARGRPGGRARPGARPADARTRLRPARRPRPPPPDAPPLLGPADRRDGRPSRHPRGHGQVPGPLRDGPARGPPSRRRNDDERRLRGAPEALAPRPGRQADRSALQALAGNVAALPPRRRRRPSALLAAAAWWSSSLALGGVLSSRHDSVATPPDGPQPPRSGRLRR